MTLFILAVACLWQQGVEAFQTTVNHSNSSSKNSLTVQGFSANYTHMLAIILAQKEAQCLGTYGGQANVSFDMRHAERINPFGCYKNETFIDCISCTENTGIETFRHTCHQLFSGNNQTLFNACIQFRESIQRQVEKLEKSKGCKCRHEGRLHRNRQVWQQGRLLRTPHVFCESVTESSIKTRHELTHFVVLKWGLVKENTSQTSLLGTESPLVFVVDEKRKHETSWRTILKTTSGLKSLPVTNYSGTYQWRITAVSERGVEDCSMSEEYTTIQKINDDGGPKNLFILRNKTKSSQFVDVLIGWELFRERPCTYKLTLESGNGSGSSEDSTRIVLITKSVGMNQWWFENLLLNTTYTLTVVSQVSFPHFSEDHPATMQFTTASCLEAFNFSFNLCAPPSPRSLTAKINTSRPVKNNKVVVRLDWLAPPHSNGSNAISKYEIEFFPFSSTSAQKSSPWRVILPGNTTTFGVQDGLEIESEFSIVLRAVTKGGRSDGVHIHLSTATGTKPDIFKEQAASGSAMGILVLLLGLAVFLLKKCRFSISNRQYLTRKDSENMSGSVTSRVTVDSVDVPCFQLFDNEFPSDLWEIPMSAVSISKFLGSGTFGTVYKGKVSKSLLLEKFFQRKQVYNWPEPGSIQSLDGLEGTSRGGVEEKETVSEKEIVAVKTVALPPGSYDDESFSGICQEYKVMQNLDFHPNIVSLFGAYLEENHLCLVLEYCPGGCLLEYLHKIRDGRAVANLTDENGYCIPRRLSDVERKWTRGGFESEFGIKYEDILSFSKQIAVGMEYLEKNKVVHRDLACRNILLTADRLNCKIGDFGLSRDIYVDNSYHQASNGRLPVKWMALESMNSARFTSKSDVWSYGILLWELMTLGATPYPGIPNGHVYHFLLYGGRPEKPKHCSRNMYALMRKCWSDQAPSRPYFSEITSAIEDTLSNE